MAFPGNFQLPGRSLQGLLTRGLLTSLRWLPYGTLPIANAIFQKICLFSIIVVLFQVYLLLQMLLFLHNLVLLRFSWTMWEFSGVSGLAWKKRKNAFYTKNIKRQDYWISLNHLLTLTKVQVQFSLNNILVLLQQRRLQPLWREWFLQGEKSRRENSLVCLNFALYATILSYWRSFFRLNVKSVKNFWIVFCVTLQNLLWNYLLDNFFVNCFNFRIFFY